MACYTKRQPTEEQKQKAAERRERFRQLVKQLAAMPPTEREALAARLPGLVTCEGHALSFHNTLLVASQCPNATMVGGFRQWLKHGRCVRKGEHGLMIWVPKKKKGESEGGQDAAPQLGEKAEQSELRFLVGTVFDVSQTEAN